MLFSGAGQYALDLPGHHNHLIYFLIIIQTLTLRNKLLEQPLHIRHAGDYTLMYVKIPKTAIYRVNLSRRSKPC